MIILLHPLNMDSTEHLFIDKFRKYKTSINNMYWGFLASKQQDLWVSIASQYKKKNSNNILHIVAFLYKIYLTKSIKSISPKQEPEPDVSQPKQKSEPKQEPEPDISQPKQEPKLEVSQPKQEPEPNVSQPKQEPEPAVSQPKQEAITHKKQKFTGAYRHTPGSNYKEWKKAQNNIKTYEKVETKLFNKWKEEDDFNPKKYNDSVPWFEYIDKYMD